MGVADDLRDALRRAPADLVGEQVSKALDEAERRSDLISQGSCKTIESYGWHTGFITGLRWIATQCQSVMDIAALEAKQARERVADGESPADGA